MENVRASASSSTKISGVSSPDIFLNKTRTVYIARRQDMEMAVRNYYCVDGFENYTNPTT
jgi:hypothetical protein